MKRSRTISGCLYAGLIFGQLGLACSDAYVPPSGSVIIGENNANNTNTPEPGNADVQISALSGALIEGGNAVSFSVSLKRQPSATVTITMQPSAQGEGTLSLSEVTFGPDNWQTPQEITITPSDDEVADGDKRWQITFKATSDDTSFTNTSINPLHVTTIDNDVAPQIVITPKGLPKTTELGGEVVLQVVLTRQPSSDVLVPVRIEDSSEATTTTSSLSFNALDWNVVHELTVVGVDDMTKDGDVRYKVTMGPANSTDEAFNGMGPSDIELINVDGVCGNGVVDGAEACEPKADGQNQCDFGQKECMVCSNACEYVPGDVTGWCGDGEVQFENGEECDAPTSPCPYGEMSCEACGPQCKYINGVTQGYCGDQKLQRDFEECDGPTEPCPYGQMSCMTCDSCSLVPGELTGYCGDGQLQADRGEECEGNNATCPVFGQASCQANCKADLSQCVAFEYVTAGKNHSCAVMTDGEIKCWGSASAQPPSSGALTALTADGNATCLSTSASTTCYGDAQGRVSLSSMTVALDLFSLTSTNVVPTIYDNALCGLTSSGQVRCSSNMRGVYLGLDAPAGSGYVDVAVAYGRACALNAAGLPVCWSMNDNSAPAIPMIDISGGAFNFCGIRQSDGGLECWGDDEFRAPSLANTGLLALDMSYSGANKEYVCAIHATGISCSFNRPTNVPQDIPGSFVQVNTGQNHVCAVEVSGKTQCWGSNSAGQTSVPTF